MLVKVKDNTYSLTSLVLRNESLRLSRAQLLPPLGALLAVFARLLVAEGDAGIREEGVVPLAGLPVLQLRQRHKVVVVEVALAQDSAGVGAARGLNLADGPLDIVAVGLGRGYG